MSAPPARSPWGLSPDARLAEAPADSESFQTDFKTAPDLCAIMNPSQKSIFMFNQEVAMPKFVIERDIPGAGKLSPAELKSVSQKSCGVLSSLGPSVQWVQSFVTEDKVYCVYNAKDESLIRRHAELGGFPANRIARVMAMIDPTTAE
jgi:hypothetical protein